MSCPFLVLCVFCQGALVFCLALFWRPPRCPKGVLGAPLGSSCARPGAPRRGHLTFVIGCLYGLSGALWGALVGSRAVSSLFFWALSLMNSRWAREVEPQTPVWAVCSKPWCFTRFWAGSGCGGPAGWCWVVVPVARRVPQGAPKEGQEALWGPLGCPLARGQGRPKGATVQS